MTLLDRIRGWLFRDDNSESPSTERTTEATSEESGEPQLDPGNVTQVRSTREDDPVSELRDIQGQTEDGEESDT